MKKRLVHFLHIGKTGGSAVKYALKEHTETGSYIIRLHTHEVTLKDVPAGDGVIFFLRDPISRFVSGFNSRQRQGRPRIVSRWSSQETTAFEHFHTPNQLAVALSSANPENLDRASKAMKGIQHVRNSYWDWFDTEDYLKSRLPDISFIGFQERLSQDFEQLRQKLGLPDDARLPGDDVQAHRNPANLERALDSEAVENLESWYRDDFRFLALCKKLMESHDIGFS